ncbi:MAG: phosphoenolpyruvate carboxykinase (ATP) [Bacteroidales bacterium]|nr:phosphoenolpyruvate carboxykinase (ATP) [Bacteroidales bacterium]HOY37901.1 phosphoenolpyruvate carboxykinase (ATP) [Bacteroidales bacterium]HQP03858.1 phosphoenolpyruvate carboxykinase (ATP) [Bacteroidales bacterium]
MAKKNISSVHERISKEIASHSNLIVNASRKTFIKDSVDNKECVVSKYGTLATWTPIDSTGRSPKDTYAVKRASSEMHIDWTSPNNLPIEEDTFNMLLDDALTFAKESDRLYVTDRVIGADSKYALPVKLITDKALPGLFADNMFRPVPKDISKSCFANKPYFLLALPYRKLDHTKYTGRLRKLADGTTSDLVVAMDFDRGIGIVIGTAYLGSIKKLMFTVMNYYLPFEGVLPLHCSANEGKDGKSALILGLSGTGKTTLSADPSRALLGDDEHGWSEDGIANFENGCYAKMININPKKEPDIYKAVLHQADYLKHGAIIENAMMYPNGEFDFDDERLTPNSRASYPLTSIKNIKKSSTAGHPSTILFLTADAYGVIPPVSKLDKSQAMLWFLMGYTSKVAGTERGVVEPSATFSRFFGQPFMPGLPSVYTKMLGEKMEKFNTSVYLINTGWTAGKFGVGHRIDLVLTRKMVNAALNGDLEKVDYIYDKLFHLSIPVSCPGVPSEILNPINTWKDPEDFRKTANELAQKFSKTFDDSFGKGHIDPLIRKNCPGK